MSGEKKLREFWIDADLGQVLRVKPFSSDSVRFSHVIEMKAYLELQQELEEARKEIEQCTGCQRQEAIADALESRLEKCANIVTCVRCPEQDTCPYAYDEYNTNGDCLAEK